MVESSAIRHTVSSLKVDRANPAHTRRKVGKSRL